MVSQQRRRRPGGRRFFPRRKVCQFCVDKVSVISYKDTPRLRRFISDWGKIESRRKTGTCSPHQRQLSVAIKRARYLAMLPYTGGHSLMDISRFEPRRDDRRRERPQDGRPAAAEAPRTAAAPTETQAAEAPPAEPATTEASAPAETPASEAPSSEAPQPEPAATEAPAAESPEAEAPAAEAPATETAEEEPATAVASGAEEPSSEEDEQKSS